MNGTQERQTLGHAQGASRCTGTKKKKVTFEEIRELVYYKDGNLFSKVNKKNGMHFGDKLGCVGKKGYIQTTINARFYFLHRLIWLFHKGYFPENDIDHINRIKSDNRIENLREVTRSCNCMNRKVSNKNKSGIPGVVWLKKRKKWRSVITIRGKDYYLGEFNLFHNAVCSRHNAEYYFGYNRCNKNTKANAYILKMLDKDHNGDFLKEKYSKIRQGQI